MGLGRERVAQAGNGVTRRRHATVVELKRAEARAVVAGPRRGRHAALGKHHADGDVRVDTAVERGLADELTHLIWARWHTQFSCQRQRGGNEGGSEDFPLILWVRRGWGFGRV